MFMQRNVIQAYIVTSIHVFECKYGKIQKQRVKEQLYRNCYRCLFFPCKRSMIEIQFWAKLDKKWKQIITNFGPQNQHNWWIFITATYFSFL
uniref:Uncharacterized protein n=1 Tax=Rhizophora mucronata TaxID=61149 RepID=A0A2P2JT37_RHIMU